MYNQVSRWFKTTGSDHSVSTILSGIRVGWVTQRNGNKSQRADTKSCWFLETINAAQIFLLQQKMSEIFGVIRKKEKEKLLWIRNDTELSTGRWQPIYQRRILFLSFLNALSELETYKVLLMNQQIKIGLNWVKLNMSIQLNEACWLMARF